MSSYTSYDLGNRRCLFLLGIYTCRALHRLEGYIGDITKRVVLPSVVSKNL